MYGVYLYLINLQLLHLTIMMYYSKTAYKYYHDANLELMTFNNIVNKHTFAVFKI